MRAVSKPPLADDAAFTNRLGIKGYVDDVPLAQIVRWSLESGLVQELAKAETGTAEDLAAPTWLSPIGADVLLGVLVAMKVVRRNGDQYIATPELLAYLDPRSPYFLGESLLFTTLPIRLPWSFVDSSHPSFGGTRGRLRRTKQRLAWRSIRLIGQRATSASKGWHLGGSRRLENQHQRNLPATVTAANLPLFESARCVVDIGGGTGTLALALRELHPDMRIVITDLPDSMHGIKQILDRFDAGGIELCPMDVTEKNWDIPDCDVIFLGNLLHVFGDRITRHVIEHAGRHLRRSGGGSLVIHEVLWDDERSGPLKAALFDFTMRGFGGKQRTAKEFKSMMSDAGFSDFVATPTRSEFVALAGRINA